MLIDISGNPAIVDYHEPPPPPPAPPPTPPPPPPPEPLEDGGTLDLEVCDMSAGASTG